VAWCYGDTMPVVAKDLLVRWSKRCAIVIVVISLTGIVIVAGLWSDRPAIGDVKWPAYTATEIPAKAAEDTVTVTWLGVTTLLFDDGETQILIDGFISRPNVVDILLDRPVESDAAQINIAMNEYRMRRIAAIIPVHSHFDHAMDIGAIANRSFASILGSSTTVQIARGAGVPEDQIILATSRNEYLFGKFTVTLIDSAHAPFAWRGEVPLPGVIEQPLKTPAPITAWREGHSYSIVIAHPSGTTLVQGSAGFVEGALSDVRADVVMLGIGRLAGIGRDYAERYWQEVVTTTGAKRVFPIHFDDYTKPFGTVELFPRILDNFVKMTGWLKGFRDTWDTDTRLQMPIFGHAIVLYPEDPPDA
jgi:L-ascorbate metabolism protein UlaG (beta-lactamase superfamily)